MTKEVRILILDDVLTDAELMTFELVEAGITLIPTYTSDKASFIRSLEDQQPDIILSDYSLPGFDGLSALKSAKEKQPEIPFIFVSGAIGEEIAIELLKQGATDYVLKDRLFRLAPAVTRALQEAEERRERKHAEEEKREAALYARSLIEASLDPLITINAEGKIMDVNKATESATGLSRGILIGSDFVNYITEPARARQAYLEVFAKGIIRDYQLAIRHVSGRITDVIYNASLYRNEAGNIQGIFAAARDITERLEAEKKILANNEMLRTLSAELVITEERERRRIAVDLHDNIGQTLALTKMKLNALMEQATPAGSAKPILEILEMVDQSIEQTRSLTRELSPSVLYELGLHEALGWLGDQMLDQHGLQIDLKNNLKAAKIAKEIQMFIYRTVRELLFNIVKHAHAKEAQITLQKSGGNIRITVQDEGCGFDIPNIDQLFKKSGGFGLFSIRERLNYMGGCLEIETRKGWGTRVEMIVPQKKRIQKS